METPWSPLIYTDVCYQMLVTQHLWNFKHFIVKNSGCNPGKAKLLQQQH